MSEHRHKASFKRKRQMFRSGANKKSRTQVNSANDLPWKSVLRPMDTGLGEDDGILELEEVEDVEVVYEKTDAGRVAKFRVSGWDQQFSTFLR
jgi:ATP-dependent RNA helicase DDX24/MAK5